MSGKLFGFRSNKTWKKVVASIWYLGWLLLALLALVMQPTVEGGPTDTIVFKAASAFMFVGIAGLPALLSDFGPLKKIPLIGSESNVLKGVGLLVVAFVWLLLFTGINGLHSDEYNAALDQRTAQQRAEQDAKRAEAEAERQRQQAEKDAEEARQREEREAAEKAAEEERRQEQPQGADSGEAESEGGQATAEEPAGDSPAENAANMAEVDFARVLTSDWGFSSGEAHAAYAILRDVGCGDITMMDGRMTEGTSLDAMRGMVGSHQVNFTADNKQVFYVQITGWKEMDYGWYVNWRGKLKYGIVDKKLSFDLYDSDTVEGGYIARYDAANDAVVPWGESL